MYQGRDPRTARRMRSFLWLEISPQALTWADPQPQAHGRVGRRRAGRVGWVTRLCIADRSASRWDAGGTVPVRSGATDEVAHRGGGLADGTGDSAVRSRWFRWLRSGVSLSIPKG